MFFSMNNEQILNNIGSLQPFRRHLTARISNLQNCQTDFWVLLTVRPPGHQKFSNLAKSTSGGLGIELCRWFYKKIWNSWRNLKAKTATTRSQICRQSLRVWQFSALAFCRLKIRFLSQISSKKLIKTWPDKLQHLPAQYFCENYGIWGVKPVKNSKNLAENRPTGPGSHTQVSRIN